MRAKEFLSQRGVPYTVKWVDQDRTAAMEMIRRSGQQGVPVIAIDGQIVVGFDQRRLEQILARRAANGGEEQPAPRVGLGAQVADAATILQKQGRPTLAGAYVGKVGPDSPAARAGLQAGDIITAAGSRLIRTTSDLARILAPLAPGSQLPLTVRRGEQLQQVEVQF